ncbi:MAG: tRNA (adenosine(37)-N6)-threonylcarbamoyltransferase complex ATPase subunit type 1 TsaE [Magnetococcus sp. WYHC-3]
MLRQQAGPILCRTADDTEALARGLAPFLLPGSIVALEGPLGAGKTLFARGVIQGLGDPTPYVTSPTFTLMNLYEGGRLPVVHLDLYRLAHGDELLELGMEEWFSGEAVVLVEWPQRGDGVIPTQRLTVHLDDDEVAANSRWIRLTAAGSSSEGILHAYCQWRGIE